jgi:hypothetical protein
MLLSCIFIKLLKCSLNCSKYSLDDFNGNRTNENRLKLNVAKQRYKRTETTLK